MYSLITDIAFLNSQARNIEQFNDLLVSGVLSNSKKWINFRLSNEISDLTAGINSRMKYSMSKLSLGIYNVLENGPGKNIQPNEEIYLFSGFGEIENVNKIGKMLMENNYSINPALFPNSVNHIGLCYYTILKKITNYTVAVNEGLNTNLSFINFLKNRVLIPADFIITSGEDDSQFYTYEEKNTLDIKLSLTAYRIKVGTDYGFKFSSVSDNFNELIHLPIFQEADNLFVDKKTFLQLEKSSNKKLFCDYPLNGDNPCAIALRLALPFYYNIAGRSLVIDYIKNKYYIFEVLINEKE
jgi:hypothetical protein